MSAKAEPDEILANPVKQRTHILSLSVGFQPRLILRIAQ